MPPHAFITGGPAQPFDGILVRENRAVALEARLSLRGQLMNYYSRLMRQALTLDVPYKIQDFLLLVRDQPTAESLYRFQSELATDIPVTVVNWKPGGPLDEVREALNRLL
jgi:hypothetical protein